MKKKTLVTIELIIIFGSMFFGSALLPRAAVADSTQLASVKAGFIYIGPIGDYGWTHAHNEGRTIVDTKYDWLETVYIESVEENTASVLAAVETLVTIEEVDVIFTTSFGYMDGTLEAAEDYPDTMFFHASGYKRAANMGTYFADFYQLYYLNGLMAGALTESNNLGYVAAFPIPEVIRHINAFALGAREVNPDATVDVRWINDWYNPTAAKNAAEALIADGIDMLAFTEDSLTVIEVADDTDGVYAFSHYSPMQDAGPTSTISGQLIHWDVLYDEILTKVHDGTYSTTNLENEDYLYFMYDDAVELGGKFGDAINDLFEDDLKAVTTGNTNVFDLIETRITEMDKPYADAFDPFTGEIKARNGTVMFADGVRATIPQLFSEMNWFVEGVKGTLDSDEGGSTSSDVIGMSFAFLSVAAIGYTSRRKKRS